MLHLYLLLCVGIPQPVRIRRWFTSGLGNVSSHYEGFAVMPVLILDPTRKAQVVVRTDKLTNNNKVC
jgi:hypothetical protein